MTIAGRKLVTFSQRVLAVGGRLGDEAPALDQLLQPDARGGIVLDDQHAFGSGWGRLGPDDFICGDAQGRHSAGNHVIFTF